MGAKCGECLGGGGRGQCRGGRRRKLLLGREMACEVGEQGKQLQREGEHFLPTCHVRER